MSILHLIFADLNKELEEYITAYKPLASYAGDDYSDLGYKQLVYAAAQSIIKNRELTKHKVESAERLKTNLQSSMKITSSKYISTPTILSYARRIAANIDAELSLITECREKLPKDPGRYDALLNKFKLNAQYTLDNAELIAYSMHLEQDEPRGDLKQIIKQAIPIGIELAVKFNSIKTEVPDMQEDYQLLVAAINNLCEANDREYTQENRATKMRPALEQLRDIQHKHSLVVSGSSADLLAELDAKYPDPVPEPDAKTWLNTLTFGMAG